MKPVYAQIRNRALSDSLQSQEGITYIPEFVAKMITILFIVGSIAFFFMFLIGAVRWVTSGGDKNSVEGARSQITHALTGLVVMFSIWAVAALIKAIFGYDLLNIDISQLIVT